MNSTANHRAQAAVLQADCKLIDQALMYVDSLHVSGSEFPCRDRVGAVKQELLAISQALSARRQELLTDGADPPAEM